MSTIRPMALDKSASINLRIDPEVKAQATKISHSFGITLTDAANIFFHKMVKVGGFPFDLRDDIPNAKTAEAIKEGDRLVESPDAKCYASFDDFVREIDREIAQKK